MYGQPDFFYISSVISSPYKLRCALPRCPGGSCRRTSSRFHGSWPVRNNRAYRLREPWCLSQSRHGRQARCDVHFTACLISSSRSSLASRPMLRRTVVSGTDISEETKDSRGGMDSQRLAVEEVRGATNDLQFVDERPGGFF